MSEPRAGAGSSPLARTPAPPYFAAIFTRVQSAAHHERYAEVAARMVELARQQPGFLGFESARDGLGISVSYWRAPEDIQAWKAHAEHRLAQSRARDWYAAFRVRVCRVEREYGF